MIAKFFFHFMTVISNTVPLNILFSPALSSDTYLENCFLQSTFIHVNSS